MSEPTPPQTCDQYRCATSNLGSGVCLKVWENNVTISSPLGNFTKTKVYDIDTTVCESGVSYCNPIQPLEGTFNCTSISKSAGPFVVGEACNNATECHSGICNAGKCGALADGADCSNSTAGTGACDIGSFCWANNTDPSNVTHTCMKQLPVSSNSTTKCVTYLDCVNNAVCLGGNCTAKFSLATGADSVDASACVSNYVDGGKCTELVYNGPSTYLTNSTNNTCSYNTTATGTVATRDNLKCVWDGSVNQYCDHPGTNSQLWQEQVSKLKAWYTGPAASLHSLRRSMYTADIVAVGTKVSYFPHLMNADKCTLALFGNGYSNAAFVKVSAFLFGLLFFLF